MSIDNFITELRKRELISDRLVVKLRDKLAETDRPLSARAVAKFLVQKRHLSQRHANEVLDALTARGEEIDAVPQASAAVSDADDGPRPATPQADEVDRRAAVADPPREETPASRSDIIAEDHDPESSSIFAPFLTGIHKKNEAASPPADNGADEVTLAPVDDLSPEPAAAPDPAQLSNIEDLKELTASRSTDDDPLLMADPLVAQINLTARGSSLRPPSSMKLKTARAQAKAAREAAKRAAARTRGKKPRRQKPSKRKNEWDSPLILVGGGALVLLVLCGVVVWWLIGSETGDDKLREAQASMGAGSYTQAISEYERFLAGHPRHPNVSSARVQLAMARLRRDLEAGRHSLALDTAKRELSAIEGEEKFAEEAHRELATLLPRIAEGLAEAAERESQPEEAARYVEQATAALSLCGITKYIPRGFRHETQLEGVRQILARVERRQKSHHDLQEAMRTIEQAIAAGDTRGAYAAHRQILKEHPELAGNTALAELVRETSAAEQAAIRYVAEEQAAETAERPTPWLATLALAHRQAKSSAAAGSQGAACIRAGGAIYGLDVASGKLLWRRHIGFATAGWPVSLGEDVLVADTVRNELLRLEAATGSLRWRQEIGERSAPPLVAGNRAFVAAESGRLYVLDVTTGTRMGYVEFGQPLTVPPAVDRRGERLYLTGDQFNIYTLSLSDLSCLGVYYLGHPQGSIQVSPSSALNKLAVLVNDGVETCRLHLLSLDERGAVRGEDSVQRLQGLAGSAPAAVGRRLIVVTDRGQLNVYDVGSAEGQAPLTLVATRDVTSRQPLRRHMAITEGHVWIGDSRLTKFAIAPTGNRLPVESTDNNYAGATFDHPLELFGETLIHAHRPQGRPGVVVAAMNTSQGRTLWETGLAMPPAGAPIVDAAAKALTIANVNGYVFRFDEAAVRSRVQDEPLAAPSMPAPAPKLTRGVDLGAGRAAFCVPGESNVVALFDPAGGNETVHWTQLPSPLACDVTPFGEGLLAPLRIGQVFYINPRSGQPLATPFQPRLQPRTTVDYTPAGNVDAEGRQFLITDGRDKLYLVELKDQPEPHFETVAEGSVGPFPIVSPIFVVGDVAMAVTGQSDVIRFRVPSLEAAGEVDVPGRVAWGPFLVGERLILATADDQLLAVTPAGEIAWQERLEAADLAGPPLAVDGGFLLAYRSGVLERRSVADGRPQDKLDVQHPLATGPVQFLKHVVLAAADGTLLVVEAP